MTDTEANSAQPAPASETDVYIDSVVQAAAAHGRMNNAATERSLYLAKQNLGQHLRALASVAQPAQPVEAPVGQQELREALAELIVLKDIKEQFLAMNCKARGAPGRERAALRKEYERRKPIAWAKARAALSRSEASAHRPLGCIKPDNDRQVFFYEQDCYVMSNFSAFCLQWEGNTFPTSEHAYHWEKFRDHPDAWNCAGSIAQQVLHAPSAHEAFKIAEGCKPRRRPDWDAVKVDIMRSILKAKVQQHEYVRRKLLATGNRELIEDSWRDDFWGWGANRDGKNMLGKLWMEIRTELRSEATI